jgi:hypothetical protein
MIVIKDPKSYEKNKKYYNTLVNMLNSSGNCNCIRINCSDCPFSYDSNSENIINFNFGCYTLDSLQEFNKSYTQLKIYYCLMLFSLYTSAEKLTYLIQDS